MLINVNPRQRDTILAALRLFQTHAPSISDHLREIAEENGPHLADDEIDTLCEGLNGGDLAFSNPVVVVQGDKVFGPYDYSHSEECPQKFEGVFIVTPLVSGDA